jgi:FAD/FMN-containing dehydrogenase
MPGGNVGTGIALDLTGLRALDDDALGDGRLRVGVGLTGAEIQDRAASVGRFFPPLPSSADRCTVGGMVANNAAGVRSFVHGGVRSWVDGLRVVLNDGTVADLRRDAPPPERLQRLHTALVDALGTDRPAWPEVAKNSSGYALDAFLPHVDPVDLLVGSEGTLGIVTEARLRVAIKPATSVLVLLPLPDRTSLPEAVSVARGLGATACEFFDRRFLDIAGLRTREDTAGFVGDAEALVLIELAGPGEAVRHAEAGLATLGRDLGVSMRIGCTPAEREALWSVRHSASPVVASRAADGLVSMQFIEDSVVRFDHLPAYLEGLDLILEEEQTDAVVFGHAGDGNVHVNPLVDVTLPDWRERVRRILLRTVDLVSGLGGTLSGEHGDGRLRGTFHPRIFGDTVAQAFRVVKETLDPAGILNPGVVVPVPGQDPLEGLTPTGRAE